MKSYGTCSVCTRIYSLRKTGLVRTHGYRVWPQGGPDCEGSGKLAKEVAVSDRGGGVRQGGVMRLIYTARDAEGRRAKHEIPNDGTRIVDVKQLAVLVEFPDESLHCSCPYLCLATYERCEFE